MSPIADDLQMNLSLDEGVINCALSTFLLYPSETICVSLDMSHELGNGTIVPLYYHATPPTKSLRRHNQAFPNRPNVFPNAISQLIRSTQFCTLSLFEGIGTPHGIRATIRASLLPVCRTTVARG
jgi:hypothetical protein